MTLSLPLQPTPSPSGAPGRDPTSDRPGRGRVELRLLKLLAQASHDHGLIEAGDRILVAVSGGKDSHCLLH
ncbi:MAG TPA: hypothetical protein VHO25_25150, partial [Polyangiaceae bacterium]|nr:hypothetical protein [Polyangiaceae bacterium]